MRDGTFRYGLSYISVLLGYAENYYRRLLNPRRTKKPSKKLNTLKEKGFTAYQITVKALRETSGSSVAHTVSYDDFCILVEHEAEIGNPKAFALLTASFRELLKLPGDENPDPKFNELLGVSPWGLPYFEREELFSRYPAKDVIA